MVRPTRRQQKRSYTTERLLSALLDTPLLRSLLSTGNGRQSPGIKMKLKQRVIVTGSIVITMVILFTIGLQINWPQPEDIKRLSSPSEAAKIKKTVEPIRSHTPTKSVNHLPPFSPPAPPNIKLPHLPDRLNWSRLGIGAWPGAPRKMLEEKLIEARRDAIKLDFNHQQKRKINLSVPPEIAELNPWGIWRGWVEENSLYPQEAFFSDEMNHILATMATGNITSFGVGSKGTQLKATAMLANQKTVFKPKRYPRDFVLKGDPYAGFDRHTGEIAGYHLDGILGFRIAPPVVGRMINLTELKPVTSKKLLETYINVGGNMCFYGVCYYCKPSEAACADGDVMEGSVTLWLPDWYTLRTKRHPYQRTYRQGVKAKWEEDPSYCQRQLLKPSSEYYYGILEFTDSAVFDFLMGNADRHHYETYSNAKYHGKLMHIDNGKTFGNPEHDELSILAPLTQCCRFRSSTWQRLSELSRGVPLSHQLDQSMRRDPLWPILTDAHLQAIDRRLTIIINAVTKCINEHGHDKVIVDSWP